MRGGWRTVRSRSSTRRAASATCSTGGDRRKALGAFARPQRQSVAYRACDIATCNVWRCDVRRGGMLQRARDAVRLTVRRRQRMRRNARDGCGLAWLRRGDRMVTAWSLRGFRSPTQRCGGLAAGRYDSSLRAPRPESAPFDVGLARSAGFTPEGPPLQHSTACCNAVHAALQHSTSCCNAVHAALQHSTARGNRSLA